MSVIKKDIADRAESGSRVILRNHGATTQSLSEPQDIVVRFDGVSKSYDGRTTVVESFDLEVRRGEFLTLIGPSGSGKTTVLTMLAGFESPTAGRILMEGKPVHRVPPHLRGIGMVFQNYALFPHMTVAQNLAFPLQVRRVPKAEIALRVSRALEMIRLEKFAQRKPAELSGGQQQRIALARALIFRPPLILMDEPLGALDKALREQMQYEIKRLHDELRLTVVYVTHDQSEALTMSDRIAVFHKGRIQQLCRPFALYEEPCNAFVASFIGENNRLDGEVTAVEVDIATVTLDCGVVVRARLIQPRKPGARTTLSIRPERVLLTRDSQSHSGLSADVVERIYCGDHVRIGVKISENHRLIVKVPNDGRELAPQLGAKVGVGWRIADCIALAPWSET